MYGNSDLSAWENAKNQSAPSPQERAGEEARQAEADLREKQKLEEIVGSGREVSFVPASRHPILSRKYGIFPGSVYRVILAGADSAMRMTFEGILARCDLLAKPGGFTLRRVELKDGFYFDAEERYTPFDGIVLCGRTLDTMGEFKQMSIFPGEFRRLKEEKTGR